MLFQEDEKLELKEIYVDDMKKEILAFANTNGGILYVGVRDDGEVVGLENPAEVGLQISNSCRDAIKPDITMFLSYRVVEVDAKKILEVRVERGSARPYYLDAKGLKPTGVYVRQGSSSVPASEEAIRRMIKETDGDAFEDMRSMNQELTFEEAKKAFSIRGLAFGETQMKSLGLMNAENIYTNLGLLLSDQCPHIIKTATFQGTTQAEFQDRKEYTGSLFKQLNDAYGYLEMRNQTRATFQGLLRIDSRDYPEAALREALLNAIVHRDYSNLTGTLVSVYANRVEMISYGGLSGGVALIDVLHGLSVCRNRKLADIFYRLQLIEAYGTGLQKINSAYADTGGEVEYLVGPSSFKIILPNLNTLREKKSETVDMECEQAVQFIREHGPVSRQEMQTHMAISAASAARLLKKLKEQGTITVSGKGKATKYQISR